jgi:hypothetical protein
VRGPVVGQRSKGSRSVFPKTPQWFFGEVFFYLSIFSKFSPRLARLDIIMMTSVFLMHTMFLAGIYKWVISCKLLLSPAFLTPIS